MNISGRVQVVAASPGTVHWGSLDCVLPDVVEVESGNRARIDTASGSASRLPVRPALLTYISPLVEPEMNVELQTMALDGRSTKKQLCQT